MELNNPNKEYKSCHHITYSCQYHVIFCPKYRRRVLIGDIEKRLREIFLEYQEKYGYEIIEMEVMPDHVHLLISNNPRVGIFETLGKLKGRSSSILRNEFPTLKSRLPCLWTRGNFISTVGSVSLETVKKYIEDQQGK